MQDTHVHCILFREAGSPDCVSLACERNLEYPEESHREGMEYEPPPLEIKGKLLLLKILNFTKHQIAAIELVNTRIEQYIGRLIKSAKSKVPQNFSTLVYG